MARRRSTVSECAFCKRKFGEGDPRYYVYPVPNGTPHETDDARLGAYACVECKPRVMAEQVEMGLIVGAHIGGDDDD